MNLLCHSPAAGWLVALSRAAHPPRLVAGGVLQQETACSAQRAVGARLFGLCSLRVACFS
jgi:hypothetical protein